MYATAAATADTCMRAVAMSSDPLICLSVPSRRLTIRGGTTSIYAVLQASRAVPAGTRVQLSISAPANPSRVKLDQGAEAATTSVLVPPPKNPQQFLLLRIRTASDNSTSGTLRYTLSAGSGDPKVRLEGSPQEIGVVTNP
jgi:hypothetical protein